jgi:hypothetical protein
LAKAPCGEKTVRKAERAWFLSGGEESEAWIRVAFDSLGQKQRVFEPYSLSFLQWSLQLSPKPFSLNAAIRYHGSGDVYIVDFPIVLIRILFYN